MYLVMRQFSVCVWKKIVDFSESLITLRYFFLMTSHIVGYLSWNISSNVLCHFIALKIVRRLCFPWHVWKTVFNNVAATIVDNILTQWSFLNIKRHRVSLKSIKKFVHFQLHVTCLSHCMMCLCTNCIIKSVIQRKSKCDHNRSIVRIIFFIVNLIINRFIFSFYKTNNLNSNSWNSHRGNTENGHIIPVLFCTTPCVRRSLVWGESITLLAPRKGPERELMYG